MDDLLPCDRRRQLVYSQVLLLVDIVFLLVILSVLLELVVIVLLLVILPVLLVVVVLMISLVLLVVIVLLSGRLGGHGIYWLVRVFQASCGILGTFLAFFKGQTFVILFLLYLSVTNSISDISTCAYWWCQTVVYSME